MARRIQPRGQTEKPRCEVENIMNEEKETVKVYSQITDYADCPNCDEMNEVTGNVKDGVTVVCESCESEFLAVWDGK